MGKRAQRTTSSRRKTKKKSGILGRIPWIRVTVILSLLGFLLLTVATVGYVIFFRTVIA